MRDLDDSPVRERWEGKHHDLEDKHRSKERSKSSRREEKDRRSEDRERSKGGDAKKNREKEGNDSEKDRAASRDRKSRDDREKDRTKDKRSEKDYDLEKSKDKHREKDKDRKDRERERDRDRDREVEKDNERARDKERERAKEKGRDKDKGREKERDTEKYRGRDRETEKHKDGDRERKTDKDGDRPMLDRERGKGRREKEREPDQDKERSRERDKVGQKHQDGHDRGKDAGKDDMLKLDREGGQLGDINNQGKGLVGTHPSAVEVEERISKMKKERLQNKSEGVSEVLAWVNKSRKLEEKIISEKEKAMQLSKIFEEQDNINQGETEEDAVAQHTAEDLAGVKVLHGLDKVIEGGAVVLTLKDQSILADGDINEEMDMLENVEIGEQKQRDEAYKAAKKKPGIYVDKFNEEPGSERKILPQYDDPVVDEGVTLDASGRFTGDTEKKLEELRKRIQGVSTTNHFEDLNSSDKITSSDYYTPEEMVRFKKPKKKKSLRKKEKIDIDALEAEAVSTGLGVGDLGSRNDGKRKAIREEQERIEAEMRSNAYQTAYAKADEASKALRMEQTLTVKTEEDDNPVFGEDDDLYKSLERARKLALKKQGEAAVSGPQAIALLASSTASQASADDQKPTSGETQENKVVFTEMEEFVWGLQLDEEAHKPDDEDVFMEEDEAPKALDQETKDEDGGWTEVKDTEKEDPPAYEDKEEIHPDETIHEAAVGKGLSGALRLLKDRGTLKETVEWGGRNMDKKKGKLVGIVDDEQKEIRIERTDEFGRILTPKEAFRQLSHKFHGKGPGKTKQEKRIREYQEELKVKQMKNSDTPSQSVERMREAQARLKTPYLVLSGNVKPGQTSDPKSGFATVEKDFPGGLTPMLGDRKVEHFLGIKRKAEPGDMGPPKKPKT